MAKLKKPQKSIKTIDEFLSYVEMYWKDSRTELSRYLSWEHCYERFQIAFAKVIANDSRVVDEKERDELTLWLAWFLASWGMYRGSSDLLARNYLIHRKIVDLLLNKEWLCLNNLECKKWNDCVMAKLNDLSSKIRKAYGEEVSVTGTLITKILLGTLGCTPAFDELFANSISFNSDDKGLLKKHIRTFSSKSMEVLCDFFKEFEPCLKKCCSKMKTKDKKLSYPQMKILDMGFWFYWKKETNNKED